VVAPAVVEQERLLVRPASWVELSARDALAGPAAVRTGAPAAALAGAVAGRAAVGVKVPVGQDWRRGVLYRQEESGYIVFWVPWWNQVLVLLSLQGTKCTVGAVAAVVAASRTAPMEVMGMATGYCRSSIGLRRSRG
jgi:hypothetical protein